jgi:hypothetical protein
VFGLTLRHGWHVRIVGATGFCSRGGIGRRVRLRTVWGNPWRFESSREQCLGYPTDLSLEEKSIGKPPISVVLIDYLRPAAFLRAAQRAFINCESLLRPAAVSPPFFAAGAFFVPPAFLLAAQRAFISSESFRRPAAVSAPFFLVGAGFVPPFSLAQRALAAAESLARVEGEK